MPNWVTNKLTITGPNSAEVMKSLVTLNEEKEYQFDFNKITPMPEELNIISGSVTQRAIDIYLSFLNPDNKNIGVENSDYELFNKQKQLLKTGSRFGNHRDNLTLEQINETLNNLSNEEGIKTLDEFIEYGKKALLNIEKFGFQDWYSWSIENWGTKWNACHNIYDVENTPSEIVFDTAWGNVSDLILKLSTMFPENEFEYEFAEEWIGSQVGSMSFKNGELLHGAFFEDGSKEAFEKAFQIHGDGLAEYYEFDKTKNTYVYKEPHDNENEDEM